MEPLVTGLFGVPWETYATSPAVATAIAAGVQIVGVLHLACAYAAFRCVPEHHLKTTGETPVPPREPSRTPPSWWAHALLIVGGLSLTFLAFCSYRDRVYRVGEFFDLACQFALPFLLVLLARGVLTAPRLLVALRVAVACTFGAHGVKALGLYPVPGEWVVMTMAATGLSEPASFAFLRIAGVLDFAIVAAVLIPWIRADRAAFAYAAFWGLLTALARPVAFIRWDNLAEGSLQWLHEGVMRLPHAALPLAGFLILRALAAPRANPSAPASPADLGHPPFASPRMHSTRSFG